MGTWQLQEAKNKFSKLVDEALLHEPQFVTRRGVDAVVVISIDEYNDLSKTKKPLIDILKSAPKAQLEISRSKEKIREISF